MYAPKPGDRLLRGSQETVFVVIDAVTSQFLSGALPFADAMDFARQRAADGIWQQQLDKRGRPFGQPFRIISPADE